MEKSLKNDCLFIAYNISKMKRAATITTPVMSIKLSMSRDEVDKPPMEVMTALFLRGLC